MCRPGAREPRSRLQTVRPGRRREGASAAAATVNQDPRAPGSGVQAGAAQAKSEGEPHRPRALTPGGAELERNRGRAQRCKKRRLEPASRPGVRRAPEQHQFGPPPPSCPSPPLPSPLPEPDFTPPAVRAERNSHFAAADPAPTTAAASVTSGRRAAGPASRAAAAPKETASGGGCEPSSSCSARPSSVTVPRATHRPPPLPASIRSPLGPLPSLLPTQGACARGPAVWGHSPHH